jgi:hypothetical protein
VGVHALFADPKTDFVFKRIFGAEARKPPAPRRRLG